MRVFSVSDIHIDYEENEKWLFNLSEFDYVDDILILAGDVSDNLLKLERCFDQLQRRFQKVLFVCGNHELWLRSKSHANSLEKHAAICQLADDIGVERRAVTIDSLSIVPLLSWYDFSFGQPSLQLRSGWVDFQACVWPTGWTERDVNNFFLAQNNSALSIRNETVISFSHFLPRIDVMPRFIPAQFRYIYPVLGTALLGEQVKILRPDIHIYGHSHVNRKITLDGTVFINNAFGYPAETRIAKKKLLCVYTV